jgi:hypothetical protein
MKNKIWALTTCTLLMLFTNYTIAQNILPVSGNVGIGTTTPESNLDVKGCSKMDTLVVRETFTTEKPVLMRDTVIMERTLKIEENIEVLGNANFHNELYLKSFQQPNTNYPRVVYLNELGKLDVLDAVSFQNLSYGQFIDANQCLAAPDGQSEFAPIWHNAPGVLYTTPIGTCPAPRVGVNISSPQHSLDVNGDARIMKTLKVGVNSIYIASIDQGTGTDNTIYASGDLLLQSNASNSYNTIINANNSGNVGIGITFPAHKLEVAGTVRACKFIAEANTWCDYVFEENYELRSIDSLAVYIQQFRHLPEVPTTQEALENGVDVVEMETILLKKIEELTLYIIQLNKRINELEGNK